MSIPLSAPMQVDVGEAFGFVFRSRNWFGRLSIGALCLLFFWLLFIPLFILLGYFVETARTISRGRRELPPWTDVGTKLKEGFVLSVVLFIWGLPGSILSSAGSFPFHCVGASCTYAPNVLAPLGGLYTLPFDLIGDLEPIIMIGSEPLLIVGKKSLPADDLKGLIAEPFFDGRACAQG